MTMPRKMLKEWAKEEVAGALKSWAKARLEELPVVDERDAIQDQVERALRTIQGKHYTSLWRQY